MAHSLAQQHQLGYAGLEPFSVALAQFAQGQAASAYFNSVGAGVNGGQFGWPAPGSMVRTLTAALLRSPPQMQRAHGSVQRIGLRRTRT